MRATTACDNEPASTTQTPAAWNTTNFTLLLNLTPFRTISYGTLYADWDCEARAAQVPQNDLATESGSSLFTLPIHELIK